MSTLYLINFEKANTIVSVLAILNFHIKLEIIKQIEKNIITKTAVIEIDNNKTLQNLRFAFLSNINNDIKNTAMHNPRNNRPTILCVKETLLPAPLQESIQEINPSMIYLIIFI